jgi:hypothetical protein
VILACLNTITFTETQCTVAPSGSGVTFAAAATATAVAVAVAEPDAVAEVTTMLGGDSVARRFTLEGEGVKFASGVEGVWIDGMGAAEAELGGMPLLVDAAEVVDASFLLPDERGVGLRCVTKRWTI